MQRDERFAPTQYRHAIATRHPLDPVFRHESSLDASGGKRSVGREMRFWRQDRSTEGLHESRKCLELG